jgi:hypothetical protein
MLTQHMVRTKKPKARFKKGEKVYLEFSGKCDGKLYTINRVHFQLLTTVFMYGFEESEICCAEMYLKRKMTDKPLKLGDILHGPTERTNELYEEGWSTKLGRVTADGVRSYSGKLSMMFFRPDQEFLKWIVEYANGRIIIDIGCGNGYMTERMADLGGKIIGVDPHFNLEDSVEMNRRRITNGQQPVHFLPKRIQDCSDIITGLGKEKGILLFARPCHHTGFVEAALNMRPKGMEALYITIPDNMEKYDDLGKYKKKVKVLEHRGRSADHEVVYLIK